MKEQINIQVEPESLKIIDAGAKIEKRSRSNFLEVAGVERAKKSGAKEDGN